MAQGIADKDKTGKVRGTPYLNVETQYFVSPFANPAFRLETEILCLYNFNSINYK